MCHNIFTMIKGKITLLAFCFLTLIITSCHAPKGLIYQNTEGLSITPDKNPSFLIYVTLYNPNKRPVAIKYGNVEAFLNGVSMGEIKLDDDIKVRGKSKYRLPMSLNPDFHAMYPIIERLTNAPSVTIKMEGSIAVQNKGKFYITPIKSEGTYAK